VKDEILHRRERRMPRTPVLHYASAEEESPMCHSSAVSDSTHKRIGMR
jgi:hypothetical protein